MNVNVMHVYKSFQTRRVFGEINVHLKQMFYYIFVYCFKKIRMNAHMAFCDLFIQKNDTY